MHTAMLAMPGSMPQKYMIVTMYRVFWYI